MRKLEIHWSLLAKSENESAYSSLINAICPICVQTKRTMEAYEKKPWTGSQEN